MAVRRRPERHHRADANLESAEAGAEVAPLAELEFYRFDIDVAEVAEVWRRGSVGSSSFLDHRRGTRCGARVTARRRG
jgi:6-phosphogluconate dehydrogenase